MGEGGTVLTKNARKFLDHSMCLLGFFFWGEGKDLGNFGKPLNQILTADFIVSARYHFVWLTNIRWKKRCKLFLLEDVYLNSIVTYRVWVFCTKRRNTESSHVRQCVMFSLKEVENPGSASPFRCREDVGNVHTCAPCVLICHSDCLLQTWLFVLKCWHWDPGE